LVAAELYLADSTIAGGSGSNWSLNDGTPCGSAPSGANWSVGFVQQLVDLVDFTSAFAVGTTETLEIQILGAKSFLSLGDGPAPPVPSVLGPLMLSNLDYLFSLNGPGLVSLPLSLPNDPNIVGIEYAFQTYDSLGLISVPTGGIIVP
jgi:hypothetical protein